MLTSARAVSVKEDNFKKNNQTKKTSGDINASANTKQGRGSRFVF